MRLRPRHVGVAAMAAGLAVVAADAAGAGVPLAERFDLVAGTGFLLWVVGVVYFIGRNAYEQSAWRPAATETRRGVPAPGDDLVGASGTEWRTRARQRAVASLVRIEGCSRAAAERRVREGDWTDDEVAAAALGQVTLELSVRDRVRLALAAEPTVARERRRVVAALRDLRGRNRRRERGDES